MSRAKTLGTALENRIVARAQAQGLDAHRQPGSGVFKDHPHDAVIEDILVEAKVRTTVVDLSGRHLYRLDVDWFRRVQVDAKKHGFAQGVLVINPKGSTSPIVLVDMDYFLHLLTLDKKEQPVV